jgi:hypothetical protein
MLIVVIVVGPCNSESTVILSYTVDSRWCQDTPWVTGNRNQVSTEPSRKCKAFPQSHKPSDLLLIYCWSSSVQWLLVLSSVRFMIILYALTAVGVFRPHIWKRLWFCYCFITSRQPTTAVPLPSAYCSTFWSNNSIHHRCFQWGSKWAFKTDYITFKSHYPIPNLCRFVLGNGRSLQAWSLRRPEDPLRFIH